MRPARDLRALQGAGLRRLARIRTLAAQVPNADTDRRVAYCAIEADTLWHNFSRSLFLSVALGTRDSAGTVRHQAGSLTSEGAALVYAARFKSPKFAGANVQWRDEPVWRDPRTLTRLLARMQATNLGTVTGALSVQTDLFTDLYVFRHFYAHRGRDTAARACALAPRYGIFGVDHPTVVLVGQRRGGSNSVLLDWLDDLRMVLERIA